MTTITNANLYDFVTYRKNQFVRFDDTIRAIGPMSRYRPEGGDVVDLHGGLLMPGLILGHTHVYSAFARGMNVPFAPKTFQDLLDQLWWKLDRHLDLPAVYASGASMAYEYLRNGVTTIIDHHASGAIDASLSTLSQAIVQDAGMRAAFCFETSDRFDVAACIRENLAFAKQTVPGRSAALFGLHASMSLSDDTLALVAEAKGDLPVHVHAAESAEDEELALKRYGCRVIERFDRFGLLTPGALLVHCVHCDDDELALLKARGVTVVVNPSSNMNNGVGLPDVKKMLGMGIPVILGDDGLSASAAVEIRNLRLAMNHRYGNPTVFTMDEERKIILETYKFASALLGVKLGRIEPGFAADLAALDYLPPTPMDSDNAFGHVVFGLCQAFLPRHVFAAGVAAV
ncbi:MAG: amidohydrolase family protein, partial [Bacillota bacterium]|nr:amidohydrolase family protein [Bacillota bacterium]